MRKTTFRPGRIYFSVVILSAVLGFTVPLSGLEIPPERGKIAGKICSTLRRRVELLLRLTADYERQYRAGSVDGKMVLAAQTELYIAKLLLMKAESGREPVPGIAVAFIRFYMASGCGREMGKCYPGGQLALSSLLNAQLQANAAELHFLQLLQTCPYHAERLRRIAQSLGEPDPALRLSDEFLRSLLDVEK